MGRGETARVRKTEWGRAWRALRGLIADPEQTHLVFEILDAMSGPGFERAFRRFVETGEGRRLLAERPSLFEVLSDRAALRALPAGSLGREYARFMDEERLTAGGLVAAERAVDRSDRDEDPDRRFFGDRLRDMHDLWHVLTGYGRDEAGEAANLAFTVGQIPSRGVALIVLAAAVMGPKLPPFPWQRYLFRAWRRGRRAGWLPLLRYEELLPRPLDEVRRMARIAVPEVAHPGGIIVAAKAAE